MPDASEPAGILPLCDVFVKGKPISQGSMNAFRTKGSGKVVMVHTKAKQLKEWRLEIGRAIPSNPTTDPVVVKLVFKLVKPKSVKRLVPSVKPDLDKLVRGVLDAMTDYIYRDDSQVVYITAMKVYVDTPDKEGVLIQAGRMV